MIDMDEQSQDNENQMITSFPIISSSYMIFPGHEMQQPMQMPESQTENDVISTYSDFSLDCSSSKWKSFTARTTKASKNCLQLFF